ncbi:hypothetical protein evm_002905 [Chilo suppressalis]|nr:hypothetical protein evm_002905 [Chilo suppressalis]
MASTVCVSRCRLLAKLEINRGLCLSPIFRDLSNNKESWCRRWRPSRRTFFTTVCAHGSKSTPSKVDHEKSDGKIREEQTKSLVNCNIVYLIQRTKDHHHDYSKVRFGMFTTFYGKLVIV